MKASNKKYYEEDEGLELLDDLPEDAGEFASEDRGICSVDDALIFCINRIGIVNVSYMAWMSGTTPEKIIEHHGGKNIFRDPISWKPETEMTTGWIFRAKYIRGNLIILLKEAEQMENEHPGLFQDNIRVLNESMPPRPMMQDVYMGLGASWIDTKHIERFAEWLLGVPFEVAHVGNKWKLFPKHKLYGILDTVTYGTSRMKAIPLLEHILNNQFVAVRDSVEVNGKKSSILNIEETTLAQEKEHLLMDKFQEWLRENPEEMKEMMDEYWELYAFAMPKYDGSMLKFPDANPAITLHPHQKNAVMRLLLSDNTVLCHDVGSGKTYAYATAVHEMYRMGISKKNLIVVPNITFSGTVKAHRTLYPQDKILAIGENDFKPATRDKELDEIRNGDYVAIYMAATKYDMLNVSYSFLQKQYISERELIKKRKDMEGDKKKIMTNKANIWTQSAYESEMDRLEKSYLKKKAALLKKQEQHKDNTDCFDLLGITTLVIDECHTYKNLSVAGNAEHVNAVFSGAGSVKADANLDKVRSVQSAGGRVIFATGTLLTNSISDLYVFQKYLQPGTLEYCGLNTIDAWLGTFGRRVRDYEVDVHGQGFRMMDRIKEYNNLPELMAVFGEVCDFYQIQDGDMHLPQFQGFQDIAVDPTAAHLKFNNDVIQRTKDIRSGIRKIIVRNSQSSKPADPKNPQGEKGDLRDSILRIVQDGRNAALDIRLVDPKAYCNINSCKAGVCAKKVAELYYKYPEGTQIIFSDLSIPDAKKEFSVYVETKKYLMDLGIPEKEIAFIHDAKTEAQKEKLLKDLESGKLRVVIGSTPKLGIGVNVQRNLIALHHLDAPWRPADLVQREGRLIRQGNLNEEVFQFRYVTRKSFDAYVWQILENKQRFIGAFLAGTMDSLHRMEEEIDEVRLSMAEIKALAVGNPMLRERILLNNRADRIRKSYQFRERQLQLLKAEEERLPDDIRKKEDAIQCSISDYKNFCKCRRSMTQEERKRVGEQYIQMILRMAGWEKPHKIGNFMGFQVFVPAGVYIFDMKLLLVNPGGGSYTVQIGSWAGGLTVTQKIEGVLQSIPRTTERLKKEKTRLLQRLDEVKDELNMGNPYTEMLMEMDEKLRVINEKLGTIPEEDDDKPDEA